MECILTNIFESWQKCYLQHTFLSGLSNQIIKISLPEDITKTYYIESSKNISIYIDTKINHLVLNKCSNVIIFINAEFISGLDIFHSNNIIINNFIETTTNYSINFGYDYTINTINTINTSRIMLLLNITVCCNQIYSLKINQLNEINRFNRFIDCLNLFMTEPIYIIIRSYLQEIECYNTILGGYILEQIKTN